MGLTVLGFFTGMAVFFSGATAYSVTNQYDFSLPDMLNISAQPSMTENHAPYFTDSISEEKKTIEPGQPNEEATALPLVKAKVPSLMEYVNDMPGDVVGGTKGIFSKENTKLALIGFGLAGLAITVDHKVKDYFQDRRPLGSSAHTGDTLGNGMVEVGLGAAMFGAGEAFGNKKIADTGIVTLEALAINGIATEGLKFAVGRIRPNGQDHMSFPSGHVSMTATLAASVSEMYDWDVRLAVPLYLATAFVGASRIQDNMHYLSDVFAGATLGTIIGKSFAKSFKERHERKYNEQQLTISPVFDGDVKGLVFTWKF